MDSFLRFDNLGGNSNGANSANQDDAPPPEPDPAFDLYRFADGSGNSYTFTVSPNGSADFYYRGIKPRESSSGIYNGGRNVRKTIAADEVQAIRLLFLQVEEREGEHIDSRQMGTGLVVLKESGNERSYFFSLQSDEAKGFERRLSELKK